MSETFPTQLADLFAGMQAQIAGIRSSRGFAPLNGPDGAGSGTISVGAEYLSQELAPPCITVVPTGEQFQAAQRSGAPISSLAALQAKLLWTSRLVFDAWLWGDEDPAFATTKDVLFSFDSTLELRREFLVGLYYNAVGIGAVVIIRGEWRQPQDVARVGRAYVLTFSFRSQIQDEPYIYLPFATDSASGVTMSTTIYASSGDGSSTEIEGAIIAPPP